MVKKDRTILKYKKINGMQNIAIWGRSSNWKMRLSCTQQVVGSNPTGSTFLLINNDYVKRKENK